MVFVERSDVLIVGAGVIGLAVARELHRSGVGKITVVEKGFCGLESSWAAGGMLGPQAEADEGGAFFDLCMASRDMYPDFAAELLDETGIDIELDRSGTLHLAFSEADSLKLNERFAWQTDAGLAVERLSAEEVRRAEPFVSPDVLEGIFFANDWQVENRRLLDALTAYANVNGIRLIENAEVECLTVESNTVVGVVANGDRFEADHIVLATGAWTSLIKIGVAAMPFKIEPVRGQMVVFQTAKRLFQHVIYSHRGYLVPRKDGRVLAGSTSEMAGFDRSITSEAAVSLRSMASEIAPSTAGLPTVDQWSGLRPFVFDGLPIIGDIAGIDGLTIATAHYRNGILLAPITAKLVAESIINKSGADAAFSPNRFRLRSVTGN